MEAMRCSGKATIHGENGNIFYGKRFKSKFDKPFRGDDGFGSDVGHKVKIQKQIF